MKKYATQGFTLSQVQIILIEDEQKQSYLKKKLAQQDSVGEILDSTTNKYLIRLSTRKVNHILFNQINILMRFSHQNNINFIRNTEKG